MLENVSFIALGAKSAESRRKPGLQVASLLSENRAPFRRFPSIKPSENLDSAGQGLNLAANTTITPDAESSRADGKIIERSGGEALLILGMHRSGTSSIAGAMVRLGGAAPLNLLPSADDNPKGFFESSVLVTLNDQILAAGESHWDDWREFDPVRIDAAATSELKRRAKSALASEFGHARLAVIKDPRMCRLLPFWSSVLR